VGQFKIGLIHGHQIVPWGDHQSLVMLQRDLDVDILVSGHTHKYETFEDNGKFFINPGSATGSYSGFTRSAPPSSSHIAPELTSRPSFSDVTPSFVLMDVQGNHAIVYTYELVNGEVKVDKFEHKKTD
jgi:vacuolar protein sorting-associated protein 29